MDNSGPGRLDLSFLKEEEANRILEVLERDEQLRKTERERLSKLKTWKRDVKWLQAVTGEWFEQIQKKKFQDDPDVRSLVRPPLTHYLKKTPKVEPASSRMTTSRNFESQKNSGPSFLGLRSPLSSLFSFRKSAKQNIKPPPQQERHGIFSVCGQITPNTEVKTKFEIYHSARSVKQIASFFEGQHNRASDNDTTKATTQLEREVFQVLGDLDQKLDQEQSHNQTLRTRGLASYKHGRQYSKEDPLHNTSESKKVYSSLSSHDGRGTVSLAETHTTHATYQPRKFYEMYSNRQRAASKLETSNKSCYKKSPSLFSPVSNTSPSSSSCYGSFSSSSLQLSSPGIDLERIRHHKSRRTPVTSIKWNNSRPSGQPEETGGLFRTQSALDLTNVGKSSPHGRVFDLYKYKNTPRVPVSTSNDFQEFSNINNISTTSCMNIADNRSTGFHKTNSPDLGPEVKYPTRSEKNWEEEYRKNSFNNNEMSKSPNENLSSNDKETKPMELESDLSVQLNASSAAEASSDLCNSNLQTEDFSTKAELIIKECKMAIDHEECKNTESDVQNKNIPVDCTFQDPNPLEVSPSQRSEPETMDVDAPNVFLHSKNTSSSTSVELGPSAQDDPPKTERPGLKLADRSLDDIKKFSTFEHRTSYKIDPPSFLDFKSPRISNRENTVAYKRSSLFSNTTDNGGRFAWMNMRRGSNDNRTEGFRSDTLRFQKRNASSLPDLIDQDSKILTNNSDVKLLIKSCENVVEYDTSTVPETKTSSRISNDSDKLHSENNSKCEQPCVHNTIQPKHLGSRRFQYLQKTYTSSYGSVFDGTFKNLDNKTTCPAEPSQASRLTEKQSKYNHVEGFMSDTLKYTKRNASSLPDLLDQEKDNFGNNLGTILLKNRCEHNGDYHLSTVLEPKCSRIPDERKEMYWDSNTSYGQSGVQDTIQQPKKTSLSTWKSLQKLPTFSYGSALARTSIKTEKRATDSEVAGQADTMTENNKVKNSLNLAQTIPFSHVHAKFKSVTFNRGQYNGLSASDSNNNTRSVEGVSASGLFKKDDGSRIEMGYSHQKQDHPETEQVKASKCDLSSKPNLSVLYRPEVVSSANQKNTDQHMQVEQGCESEKNLNQNLIFHLDQEANGKAVEYTDPPQLRDSSKFPISQTVKEHSEGNNFSITTHQPTIEKKSINLLKQHLFVAPQPFKRNVHISVIPKSDGNHSSSEDSQTPTSQEGENIKDLGSENKASQEGLQLHKTYTCQQVIENTEIYESFTDSPEADKIEYRKVISVYYSLPRKFSRRISDVSKNNLKNIDNTLEQNRAPSVLLDRISRCHTEEPDSNPQNSEKTLTSSNKTIRNEEVHSVDDVPSETNLLNFHFTPLQTDLMKNGSRTNSGEESEDLLNKFSSLHTSENDNNYTAKEDSKNKNEYSPSRSSPRYAPNIYHTIPNKKSSLQDLERNVLERDIAMARDRFNIYSSSRNVDPSPPGSQDVFTSPEFSYDNDSSGNYFMHLQENNKRDYNINNVFAKTGGLFKKNSVDEGLFLREDLPSIYKSKSFKDLSQRTSYNTEITSPHMECNTSPQTDYNNPILSKNNDFINRTRPSYCSEFVQKKMKPINAKKFSFSSDHSGTESVNPRHTGSYRDTVRISDADSPPVLYSQNDNYPSYVNRHFGQRSPKHCQNDTYSNLYRSKSMKFLNTEGKENFMDYKRKSDGSFSSKSYGGTLRSKSPSSGDTWNRRLSAEMLDENDNWPVSEETYEHKPVCTSKSLDYGIFGKAQQEAILNNVKRSLTEGRLWRPSFLKNPGSLRTEEHCSSQETKPVGRSPDHVSSQGPNFKDSLNIYEDKPVSSDTDTTTDDEYYLDENEKESEL